MKPCNFPKHIFHDWVCVYKRQTNTYDTLYGNLSSGSDDKYTDVVIYEYCKNCTKMFKIIENDRQYSDTMKIFTHKDEVIPLEKDRVFGKMVFDKTLSKFFV